MHETRYDWLADRWVIFAPNREERPNEFRPNAKPCATLSNMHACPFCSGSERETPEPTLVLPVADTEQTRPLIRGEIQRDIQLANEGWRVRVVPNKFPAIHQAQSQARIDSFSGPNDPARRGHHGIYRNNHSDHGRSEHGHSEHGGMLAGEGVLQQVVSTLELSEASPLFQRKCVSGTHEVIIESPNHIDSITSLPIDQVELVLQAYRMRLGHWRSQRGLQYAVVFKNYGADAGASLSHTHSQLMCLDFVPSDIERTHRRLTEYRKQYNQCYICHLQVEELRAQERIVMESESFVAFCPFASRFPFAFSIMPKKHRCHFDEVPEQELQDLAKVLKACLVALETAQPYAAYNYVLQTAPFHRPDRNSHHWRLRVIPRLSKVAGFEWGSDCFINTIKPELAASVLRSHLPAVHDL
ncbi:galactose-1-phosphate uridylyltransferase [Pirellulaceae bacterium SH501]